MKQAVQRTIILGAILFLLMVFTFSSCGGISAGGNTPNPFNDSFWTFSSDGSKLAFGVDTWTWDGRVINDINGISTKYNFRGNYTYSGNIAEMTATHYLISSNWISWSGQWTATLNGDGIRVVYNGSGRSIINKEDIIEYLEYNTTEIK